MTIEIELSITFGYIVESFSALFSLIDRFNILSAAEGLAECNFSNIREKSVSRMMKNWSKDVSKYFESNNEKPVTAYNIKLPDQYDTVIKDFSKRLEDFINTEVNSYLENVRTELLKNQENEIVSQCLNMIIEALTRKQKYLLDFQKLINERFPEQSSVSESDLGGN